MLLTVELHVEMLDEMRSMEQRQELELKFLWKLTI